LPIIIHAVENNKRDMIEYLAKLGIDLKAAAFIAADEALITFSRNRGKTLLQNSCVQ